LKNSDSHKIKIIFYLVLGSNLKDTQHLSNNFSYAKKKKI
jgi:hypothetical protein